MHGDKLVSYKFEGVLWARIVSKLVFECSCNSIEDTSFFETIDDNFRAGLNRLPSRNEPAHALGLDDSC